MNKKIILLVLLFLLPYGFYVFPGESFSTYQYLNADDNSSFNLNSTAFAYYFTGSTSTLIKFKLGTPSSTTIIGSPKSNFFGAGDWANPEGSWNFYVVETVSVPAVYRVDTVTGNVINLGNVTGVLSSHSIAIMEWDIVTNQFYIISSNSTTAQLYTLNWTTKAATTIGMPITTCPGIAAGGLNRQGNFYVIDYISDNIYKINKTTGSVMLIGPLGFNADANIDGAYDRYDWKFYCTRNTGSTTSLLQFDSVFSNQIQIGNFTVNNIIAMCVVSFPTTSINQISTEIPDSYTLYQNYPNPFNPITNIKFKIKDAGLITLKVFNILGKEIATLVNENLRPGEYEVTYNGSKLNSGIYFYRLISNNFSETKKMILIK